MATSGAILREVGTTNKTRIEDYRSVIGDQTAALLRCHTSNFRVIGFTEQPATQELVDLSLAKKVPFIDDIGSGALIDLSAYGIADEPLVTASVKSGADLVLFSGDKLLGGPQCGIVVGRKHFVEMMAKNPLMRAMRVDKVTLAALAATLELYRHPDQAIEQIPLLKLLSTNLENLENRAGRTAQQMTTARHIATAEAVRGQAQLGGGSVPAQSIPTWCVQLTPDGMSLDELARRLRMGSPPIFGRIHQNHLLLDLRTVFAHQDISLVEAVMAIEG